MLGSVDTRRGTLSAVVRIRSPVAGAAGPGCSTDQTAEPPELGVRRDGSRRVTVGVPECRGAPRQKETFEVTQVLPLDASPEEIFAGVGGPVVDWLWDGFNAVVLSYGQARSGKTTLLLGNDPLLFCPRSSSASAGRPSPEDADDGRRRRGRLQKDDGGADAGASEAEGGEREGGGGGGLLRDILRVVFDNAAATAPAASAPADAIDYDPAHTSEHLSSATGVNYDVLNPLAGSWSPSRHACDGPNDSFDAVKDTAEKLFGSPDAKLHTPGSPPDIEGVHLAGGGASERKAARLLVSPGSGGKGGEERDAKRASRNTNAEAGGEVGTIVALSAWEVAGKNVTDLFVSPPWDSGSSNPSGQGTNPETTGVNKGVSRSSSSSSNSNNNRGLENTAQSGKSGGGGRSRSRNVNVGSKAAEGDGGSREGSGAGGGGGGGGGGNGNGRGRRRRSRGRSGSDDSSTAGGGGWPSGYPEGFLTVRATSLAVALALVDTAQRNSGRRQAAGGTPGEPGAGKGGKGGGGGKRGAAAAGAAITAAPRGHVFFRVVIYNALEETVSTLHVVDLAGGWEPPSEKPGGRRGSKGSGTARPSAVSREWNSFDAMMAGLVPPSPSPPPPAPPPPAAATASRASAAGSGAVDEESCPSPSRSTASEQMPCSCCGAVAGSASGDGGSCCVAEADETSASIATTTAETTAPCGALDAAEQLPPPPPPPPPPHPVFGSPKGKTFGGGGGGKLVEALRPLMSGNTRTWLVVSVGGGGKGGPPAAWRALDVARRVVGVSTTCIRLRGVALADLGLRSSDEVLTGNEGSREHGAENTPAASAGGESNRVVDRRRGRTNPATCNGPTKAANTSGLTGLGATGFSEAGLLSAAADQSHTILASLGGGAVSSFPSSPASSSLSGPVHGESLLSLADTPLGEGGGGEVAGTTYVDNFLAGFARACGGDEDDRPRRISSGGALGADVVLSRHEEDVAAAWRAIATEVDAGGSEGRRSNSGERGVAAAAAVPGHDRRNAGELQRQHPPLLQGSPLRPGGRAAVVPSTRLPSKLGRPGAPTRLVSDGNKNSLARDTECRGVLAGVAEGQDRRSGEVPHGTAVGVARRTAEGTDAVSPTVSKARGNIDRMMSSLLEEVLPARRKEENSEKAGNASVRRSCSPRRQNSPSTPAATAAAASPALAGRSGKSTPGSDGAADSNSSGFLTPIEVLMHAPAGGGHAGCPQCSQSPEVKEEPGRSTGATPANGTAVHRHDKEPRPAAHPTGRSQEAGQVLHSRASAAVLAAATNGRVKDGRVPSSFSKTDGNSAGGGGITDRAGRRSRGASEAAGHRVGGNNAAGAAETKKTPKRTSIDNGNGSEISSVPAGEAGVCGTIEVGDAGSTAGCPGELEAETGAGVALMRRNHAALLRVVREQEDRRKQMERRFEAKECDWLERVTSLEAELDGLRAEAVDTRGRLRRAESSSPSAEVFERYEAHAGILEAENTSLRDQNIALELRLLDLLRQSTTAVPRRPASPAAAGNATATDPRHDEDQQQKHQEEDDVYGVRRDDQTQGVGSLGPAATTAPRFARGSGGTPSKFRVDGRITRPVREDSSSPGPGGGAPMCAAVLKDLRRRLKEAELEARTMRAERAAADKRDRLCQAQLRALTEQRSKVRELFLREKEHEARLTASRLESARAEAIADNKAAQVERLRENQASLEADRQALVLELADERRKSRRFDEDRRAYGHIRRFIERHAGGRPAEWDEGVPQGDDGDGDGEGLGLEGLAGIDGAGREPRYQRQHHHHHHHHRRRSGAAGVGIGYTEDAAGGLREYPGGVRKQQHGREGVAVERQFPGARATTRRGGGDLGAATTISRATGACDSSGGPSRWQRSSSAPRRTAATTSFAPDDIACVAESTERLYSEVYRDSLDARFRASRGLGGCSRGAVGDARGDRGDDGSPPQDDDEGNSHIALKFSVGRERPWVQNSPASDPRRMRGSGRIPDGRKTATDDENASGGDNGAPYHDFGTTTPSWRAAGTDNTTTSPRLGWRGLGDEAEETEPESEVRSSRSALARGFGAGLRTDELGGGAMGAAWQSGSRLAGTAIGSRSVSRAGRSFAGGGLS